MTRIVAISDIHGHLIDIPECDLLIIAGDVTPIWNHNKEYQWTWLAGDFRMWLDKVPAKQIVGIAGNHDFIFEHTDHILLPSLRWTYLQDTATEIDGLKIYGTPWVSIPGHRWAFDIPETMLDRKWAGIPENLDILICHSPPIGFGDKVEKLSPDDTAYPEYESVGSPSLLATIIEKRPKAAFFGHIHSGHGYYKLRTTDLYNCAILDDDYKMKYPPTIVEV